MMPRTTAPKIPTARQMATLFIIALFPIAATTIVYSIVTAPTVPVAPSVQTANAPSVNPADAPGGACYSTQTERGTFAAAIRAAGYDCVAADDICQHVFGEGFLGPLQPLSLFVRDRKPRRAMVREGRLGPFLVYRGSARGAKAGFRGDANG